MSVATLERPTATTTLERPSAPTCERPAPPSTPPSDKPLIALPDGITGIFLMGLAGSGKDSIAACLRRDHGFYTLALADAIREEYATHRGSGKPSRTQMIDIGEGYKTIYGQDVWCDRAISAINDAIKDAITFGEEINVCITDVRYDHEYDYFMRRGWRGVWVAMSEDKRLQRLVQRDGDAQLDALQYEREHFTTRIAPYVILNDGTLDELTESVSRVVKRIESDGAL